MHSLSVSVAVLWGIPLLTVAAGCSAAPGNDPSAELALDDTSVPVVARSAAKERDYPELSALRNDAWGQGTTQACTSDQVQCGSGCCGPTDEMECVSGVCQPYCSHAQPLCGGVCCPQGQLCVDGACQ